MNNQRKGYLKKLIKAATGARITDWEPQLAIILTATFIHITTSVDLGYESLEVRIPLAVLSMVPVLILIKVADILGKVFTDFRVKIVLAAFLLGGVLRGWILDESLRKADILLENISAYRVLAGVIIITFTCVFVNALWSNIQGARSEIRSLHKEAKSLEEALTQLSSMYSSNNIEANLEVSQLINSQLIEIGDLPGDIKSARLNEVIEQIVRPVSRELAKELQNWSPAEIPDLKITFRGLWNSLKPIQNLPLIRLGIIFIPVAPFASATAVFGFNSSIKISLAIAVGLAFSLPLTYWFIGRFITQLNSPIKFLLMHLAFMFITLPPTLLTTFALRESANPDAYLVAGIIVIPIFYWIIMVANATWSRTLEVQLQLMKTRDHLIWAIARINLLNWYHRGVVSRLLHGPIQNILFVGMAKLQRGNSNQSSISIDDLTAQIDKETRVALNAELIAGHEKELIEEIAVTWEGIARIEIDFDAEFQLAMNQDMAAANILIDLVREVCSNSIRHGGADSIQISGKCEDKHLRVDIFDNGKIHYTARESNGIGLAFLDACCVSIERTSSVSGNSLSMTIPAVFEK